MSASFKYTETSTLFRIAEAACVIRAILYHNGYIPVAQINTHNAAGKCAGVCGVPSSYAPAQTPLITGPASRYYDTNNVFVPLQDGTLQLVAYKTPGEISTCWGR